MSRIAWLCRFNRCLCLQTEIGIGASMRGIACQLAIGPYRYQCSDGPGGPTGDIRDDT